MRRLVGLVRLVLTKTFAEPVREGRLVSTGWPAGLRSFVVVAVVVYVVTMATAVLATTIRRHSAVVFAAPDQSLPVLAVPLIGVAATLTLACLYAAALHARLAFRVPAVIVVIGILLAPVDWSAPGPFDLVTAGTVALLPVLAVVRARRSFHWVEPVLAVVLVGLAVVSEQSAALAPLVDLAPGLVVTSLSQLTNPLWALAAPVSILAGATLVEVTTSLATWTTVAYWSQARGRSRTRAWTAGALVVLVAVRVVQETRRIGDPSAPVPVSRLLLAALVFGVVAGGCTLSTTLADRTAAGDDRARPDPDDLLPVWHRCAPAIAVALGATVALQPLLGVLLSSFGLRPAGDLVAGAGGDAAVLAYAAVTSVAILVVALVLSTRGWRRIGLVLTATGLMYAFQTVFTITGALTGNDDVLAVATLAAVLLLVVLSVRRRLTTEAEVAIAGVLLLTAAYGYRAWFDDPLTSLVGLGGFSAALLVGLVWRLLTDNGYARGDSASFPEPSRVLLALANALVGVTSAALVALLGGRSLLDPNQTEGIGDNVLGFPLVLAVVFAGLTLAARGRGVGSTQPEQPARGEPDVVGLWAPRTGGAG